MKSQSTTVQNFDNLELPGVPPVPKKRGRPVTGQARSNSTRQSNYRNKLKTDMYEMDEADWTEKHCLYALGFFPAGSPLHKAAWLRLAVIANYR